MKNFTKSVLALSLLVGSASFAQDNISALYPAEDVDSPTYYQTSVNEENVSSLAKSSISNDTYKAFYDKDSWEYAQNQDSKSEVYSSAKSTVPSSLVKELYQES